MDTRPTWFIAIVLLFAASIAYSSESSRGDFDEVRELLEQEFARDGRGGLTVGVVEQGELVWTHSIGFTDEAEQRPATRESIYPIASVTKMLTGIMLLQLVERGSVHLADPAEKYVPEMRQMQNAYPWAPPVSLMQLATMTAGVQVGISIPEDRRAAFNAATTWEEAIAVVIPSFKYQYEPGTVNRYSNAGYAILGLALSRAAKRPFADYARTEILEPLGMRRSGFSIPADMQPHVARGYALNKADSRGQMPWVNPSKDLLLPAAGLLTDVGDLAKLMRFQMLGGYEKVLSNEMLQASYRMLVPSSANLQYGDGVGFAAVRDPDGKLAAIGHGGAFPEGFVTSYEFDGTRKTGVILLANTYAGQANYKVLVRRILARLNPTSPGGSGLAEIEQH
ncbi:serine hydrolase domain-containing protein [Peristeroidobacter agariperforans]|uniref:serine hydrolase domain-containing protein n=1 Tax=Peristeroidobacter agariperforans TaxID=268404 RepID=UPI00101DC0BE|nr:serine hydrolase domain-containing protein [Peristeroidobacter agariperforans]